MRALIILAVLATPALAKMRPPDDASLTAGQIASATGALAHRYWSRGAA